MKSCLTVHVVRNAKKAALRWVGTQRKALSIMDANKRYICCPCSVEGENICFVGVRGRAKAVNGIHGNNEMVEMLMQ